VDRQAGDRGWPGQVTEKALLSLDRAEDLKVEDLGLTLAESRELESTKNRGLARLLWEAPAPLQGQGTSART
jgi:hypothetical protein